MFFKSQRLISMNICEKASSTYPSNLLSAITPSPGQSVGALSQANPPHPAQVSLVRQGTAGSKTPTSAFPVKGETNQEATQNTGHSLRDEGCLPRTPQRRCWHCLASGLYGAQIQEHEDSFKKKKCMRGCTIHTPILEIFLSLSLGVLL